MHSTNYTPQARRVIRGFGSERAKLLDDLREREGDLTHFIVAFGRPTEEQTKKIDNCRSEIARIIARLEEITVPV